MLSFTKQLLISVLHKATNAIKRINPELDNGLNIRNSEYNDQSNYSFRRHILKQRDKGHHYRNIYFSVSLHRSLETILSQLEMSL